MFLRLERAFDQCQLIVYGKVECRQFRQLDRHILRARQICCTTLIVPDIGSAYRQSDGWVDTRSILSPIIFQDLVSPKSGTLPCFLSYFTSFLSPPLFGREVSTGWVNAWCKPSCETIVVYRPSHHIHAAFDIYQTSIQIYSYNSRPPPSTSLRLRSVHIQARLLIYSRIASPSSNGISRSRRAHNGTCTSSITNIEREQKIEHHEM